jgi:hypothetical protein
MAKNDVAMLISAAGGDDLSISVAISHIGEGRAAAILIDELVSRADLREQAGPACCVHFELLVAGRAVPHMVRVSGDGVTHGPRSGPEPDATVRQDFVELTRGVFGPAAARTSRTRQIIWHNTDPISDHSEVPRVAPTVHRLLRGAEMRADDLGELSLRFGIDKWGLHYYTQHYERHLSPWRDRPVVLIEFGIGGFDNAERGGGSLRMWKRFLHRAQIYGVDIARKNNVAEQRIYALQGDQSDHRFLESLLKESGPPDIVIDDGSHQCADVIATFGYMFPRLQPGGVYLVEDLQTSYWPAYGGSSVQLSDRTTSMGFFKALADSVNYEELMVPDDHVPAELDRQVTGIHFYHNLSVIEKGTNAEGTLPPWHPARFA